MSNYDEIRVSFLTSARKDHPRIQHYLQQFEHSAILSSETEILESDGGKITNVMWYDSEYNPDHSECPPLLALLETAHIPYDAEYYNGNFAESNGAGFWYRPHATPDHNCYEIGEGKSPVLTWDTITNLAGNDDTVPLAALRIAAHLPPTDLLQSTDSNPQGPG